MAWRSRRLKIDDRVLPRGFVRVGLSPQRSPQVPQSSSLSPFLYSRASPSPCFLTTASHGLPLPPFPSPGLPPFFSQQVKSIWKRTLLIFLVRPIILGFLITHLILYSPVKISDRSRPLSLSNHQQPCHNLRVISRRESRLLVVKRTV